MKRALLFLVSTACLLALPLADAQMSSALTLIIHPPEEALVPEAILTLQGVATYTADVTGMANLNGIPVTYHVTAVPVWAVAIVSPATDVFPIPSPTLSPSFTVTRMFTVTIVGDPDWITDASGLIEVVATATPTAQGGRPATSHVQFPVMFDAPDLPEECDTHALLQEAVAVLPQAMETMEAQEDDAAEAQDDEQTDTKLQSSSSTPLALPIATVGGFAAVGVGAGLLLRRRLRK